MSRVTSHSQDAYFALDTSRYTIFCVIDSLPGTCLGIVPVGANSTGANVRSRTPPLHALPRMRL